MPCSVEEENTHRSYTLDNSADYYYYHYYYKSLAIPLQSQDLDVSYKDVLNNSECISDPRTSGTFVSLWTLLTQSQRWNIGSLQTKYFTNTRAGPREVPISCVGLPPKTPLEE